MDIQSGEQLEKISMCDTVDIVEDITVPDSFNSFEKFEGILNGNGHTISGLNSTFIHKVCEDSIIRNVNFENVSVSNSKGIFEDNRGCIDSISVKGLRKEYGKSTKKFGGIVGKNLGSIKNCSVSDLVVYQQGDLGCISAVSNKGSEIINCHVESAFCVQSGDSVGGIVANCKEMSIKECSVSNTEITGAYNIGGIGGYCTDVEIADIRVSSCDFECDEYGVGGVVAEGKNTQIRDASINTVNLTARSNIYLVGKINHGKFVPSESSNGNGGLLKSCSVVNCKATAASEEGVHIFSQSGVVQDCFVRNSKIVTSDPYICTELEELQNSYVDVEITTSSTIEVRESTPDENFYITTEKRPVESKKICVSEPEDLDKIQKNNTVELVSDIDLEECEFSKIERFSGTFNGNGYTIYNLTKPLFSYLNGNVKNLNIHQSKLEKHARSGFLSKSIEKGMLRNISITKESLKPTEQEVYGISHSIEDSSIINCTISFDFTTETTSVCGISEYCYMSTVQDCSIDINACKVNRGSGVAYNFDGSTLRNTHTTGAVDLIGEIKKFGGITSNIDGSTVVNCSSKITISSDSMSLYKSIGGIIASLYGDSTIKDCVFKGEIRISNMDGFMGSIGGITGKLNGGIIRNCCNKSNISIEGDTDTSVGGICGESSGEVINCINQGEISGKDKVGGLVGISRGTIVKSKNTAKVSGDDTIGGIAGLAEGNSSVINNCYNHSVVSGKNNANTVLGNGSENVQLKYVYFVPYTDGQKSKYAEKKFNTQELDVLLGL